MTLVAWTSVDFILNQRLNPYHQWREEIYPATKRANSREAKWRHACQQTARAVHTGNVWERSWHAESPNIADALVWLREGDVKGAKLPQLLSRKTQSMIWEGGSSVEDSLVRRKKAMLPWFEGMGQFYCQCFQRNFVWSRRTSAHVLSRSGHVETK